MDGMVNLFGLLKAKALSIDDGEARRTIILTISSMRSASLDALANIDDAIVTLSDVEVGHRQNHALDTS